MHLTEGRVDEPSIKGHAPTLLSVVGRTEAKTQHAPEGPEPPLPRPRQTPDLTLEKHRGPGTQRRLRDPTALCCVLSCGPRMGDRPQGKTIELRRVRAFVNSHRVDFDCTRCEHRGGGRGAYGNGLYRLCNSSVSPELLQNSAYIDTDAFTYTGTHSRRRSAPLCPQVQPPQATFSETEQQTTSSNYHSFARKILRAFPDLKYNVSSGFRIPSDTAC